MTEQRDSDSSKRIVIASRSASNQSLKELGAQLRAEDEAAKAKSAQQADKPSTQNAELNPPDEHKRPIIDKEGATVLAKALGEAVIGAAAAAQVGRVAEEVLDEEPNSPAQRPAPEATPEPQLTPEEKEANRLEALPYVALRAEIIDEDDTRKRQPKLDQLNKRVYELTRLGIFDRVGIKDGIKERARRSTWEKGTPDYFYTQLAAYASSQENEARGTSSYRDNTRYEGLIKDAVSMTATQITVAGLDARRGQVSDFGAYVNEKLSSTRGAERLNELRKNLRAKILDFNDLELKDLVDTPAPAPAPTPTRSAGRTVEEILEEQLSVQKDQAELEKRQLALLMQGYDGFVQLMAQRGRISPEEFDKAQPAWYKELSDQEQGIVRFLAHNSYLAGQKRDTGMVSLEFTRLAGLRFETVDFANAFQKMPGFREFIATAMVRVFDPTKDHLVISGEPGHKDAAGNWVEPTGGYAILSNQRTLDKFKKEVAEQLVTRYGSHREVLEQKYRLKLEDIMKAGVNAADNMFYAWGAYSSGDEERAITPGEANIYSEQERAMFMPGVKGEAKWLKKRKETTGEAEEDYGGPMGAYMRYGLQNNPSFKARYEAGARGFIPQRLFYSMLDMTDFSKGAFEGKTMAQGFLTARKVQIAPGVYDYNDGLLDLNDLKPNELGGSYADIRNAGALPLYEHLTSKDPKARMDMNGVINALTKVRGSSLLNEKARDPFFVAALVAMAISPETGPLIGVYDHMLLAPAADPKANYDSEVTNALSDRRLFVGMPSGYKERLFRLFMAIDTSGLLGALRSMFTLQSMLAERNRLINQTRA